MGGDGINWLKFSHSASTIARTDVFLRGVDMIDSSGSTDGRELSRFRRAETRVDFLHSEDKLSLCHKCHEHMSTNVSCTTTLRLDCVDGSE